MNFHSLDISYNELRWSDVVCIENVPISAEYFVLPDWIGLNSWWYDKLLLQFLVTFTLSHTHAHTHTTFLPQIHKNSSFPNRCLWTHFCLCSNVKPYINEFRSTLYVESRHLMDMECKYVCYSSGTIIKYNIENVI